MWEMSTPPHLAAPWIIHKLLFAENKWSRFSDFASYFSSSLFRDESCDDGVSLPPQTCVPVSKLIRRFAARAIGKVVRQEPVAASSPSRPEGNKAKSVGLPWQPGDGGRKCYYWTRWDKINRIDLTLWYTQQVCHLLFCFSWQNGCYMGNRSLDCDWVLNSIQTFWAPKCDGKGKRWEYVPHGVAQSAVDETPPQMTLCRDV